MSQSENNRRSAFLNDVRTMFGMDKPNDYRLSDADIIFSVHGEEKCRGWLAQANGNYTIWKQITDIKQARRKYFKPKQTNKPKKTKRKARKKVLPKSTHKEGDRMREGKYKYVVEPDGTLTTLERARKSKDSR